MLVPHIYSWGSETGPGPQKRFSSAIYSVHISFTSRIRTVYVHPCEYFIIDIYNHYCNHYILCNFNDIDTDGEFHSLSKHPYHYEQMLSLLLFSHQSFFCAYFCYREEKGQTIYIFVNVAPHMFFISILLRFQLLFYPLLSIEPFRTLNLLQSPVHYVHNNTGCSSRNDQQWTIVSCISVKSLFKRRTFYFLLAFNTLKVFILELEHTPTMLVNKPWQ